VSGAEPPVTVRLFAAAAEAVGSEQALLGAATVGELVAQLVSMGGPETAHVLGRCAILVGGTRADDPATPVPAGVVVDVLPPFAGG